MHPVLPVPMDLGQIDTAEEKEARLQPCILLFVKVEQWLDARYDKIVNTNPFINSDQVQMYEILKLVLLFL